MLHDQTNGIKNRHKQKHETYEIEHKFKARRAQGGKGLLSHSISVQELKNPSLREEREEEQRGREGRQAPREGRLFLAPGEKGRERERGGEGVFNPNNSHPKRLNYP